MKPLASDASRTTTPQARPVTSSSPLQPHERWLVRGLMTLGGLVIAAVVWQTIGRDVLQTTRRLPVFRRVAPLPVNVALTTRSDTNFSVPLAASSLTGLPATSRWFEDQRVSPNVTAPARPGEQPDGAAVIDEPPQRDANGLAPAAAVPVTPPVTRDVNAIPLDLLQAAAQLVSLGWQDFDYPAKWFASETSKPRMFYNGHRNRLLNAIAHPRPSELSLAQLRKDYAAAREQFADDPRLDYACGLALWHHGERSEALEVFQTAARLEQVPFLPAALAVAWGRLLNGEERRGLDQLNHVAKLLAVDGPHPTQTQREQAALCLGRAFGFLNGPGRTSELAEATGLTTRNVRERLPADLLLVFEEGFELIGQRESELRQFASLPENALQAEHRQQSDELQTRINTLRDEMQQTRQELARGHLSYLSQVSTYLSDMLKARAESFRMMPQVTQLKESLLKLNLPTPRAVVRSANGELTPINSSGSNTTRSPSSRSSRNASANTSRRQQIILLPETPVERAARMAKLEQARQELKRIQDELAKLRDKHQELLDQRHQAAADRQAATQETRQLQASRIREQRELEKRLRELNTALRQTQSLRNSLDTVAAHVPWTVEVEGEALRLALTKNRTP